MCSVLSLVCALQVDGQWGAFGSWSSCSVTCGSGGQRTRQRVCNSPPPSGGGDDCSGSSTQQESCSSSTTCPGERSIVLEKAHRLYVPPSLLPAESSIVYAACTFTYHLLLHLSLFYPSLVDGQWGPFGSWSSCSVTCGGGVRTRERLCNNPPPSGDGADCVGSSTRRRNCNVDDCPGEEHFNPIN